MGKSSSVLVGHQLISAVDKGGNIAAPLCVELLGGTSFLDFIAPWPSSLSWRW
ncbi:hypothetical protein DFAR_3850053 [Desulfarculales bacterium]